MDYMTQDREELLIANTASTAATLDRFIKEWDDIKGTFATKAEVKEVNKKISDHECDHVTNKGLIAAWSGTITAIGIALFSMFKQSGGLK